MAFYSKYIKYKTKYLQLKKVYNNKTKLKLLHGAGKFEYLRKMKGLILPKKYQIEIFKQYFDNLKNKKAIEIGIGNSLRSIPLSKLFESYYGVEQNKKLMKLSKENCKKYKCNIHFIQDSVENLNLKNTFDVAIFINTFHFINKKKTIEKLIKIIDKKGIIFIDEPKPRPYGWGSPVLNKDSPQFDPIKWKRKETNLNETKDFLLHLDQKYGLKVKYYDLKNRNVFILQVL